MSKWISVKDKDYPVYAGMYMVSLLRPLKDLQYDYFDGSEFAIEEYGAVVTHWKKIDPPEDD